jgi:hypothetical protein
LRYARHEIVLLAEFIEVATAFNFLRSQQTGQPSHGTVGHALMERKA